MPQSHQEIADDIVGEFMQQLEGAVLGRIPQEVLTELCFKIRQALDAQTESAAKQLEELASALRRGNDHPQIEL